MGPRSNRRWRGAEQQPDPDPTAATAPEAEIGAAPVVAADPAPLAALPQALVIGRPPIEFEPRLASTTVPYRPDSVVDGGHADGLIVRVASVRGRDKRAEGVVRDDDFCIAHIPAQQAVAIAIADGMGSAERGYLGAVLSCRHAIEEVQAQLETAPVASLDWPKLFVRARSALQLAFRDHAGRDETTLREVSRDVGTTLVVAVVQRSLTGMDVSVAAVGDSPCWTLDGTVWEQLVGFEADEDGDGFTTNDVLALPYRTDPDIQRAELREGQVLVLATDGFGRPLGNGRNDLGAAMAEYLRVPPPLEVWTQLVDFGRRTYGDDRTIAAVWAKQPAPR